MKTSVIFTLLLTVIALSSFKGEKAAEAPAAIATTSLSGSIMDLETGELLVGVEVELEGMNQKVYTDFDGNYTFNNLKEGTYKVSAHLISYKNADAKEVVVSTTDAKKVNLKLDQLD